MNGQDLSILMRQRINYLSHSRKKNLEGERREKAKHFESLPLWNLSLQNPNPYFRQRILFFLITYNYLSPYICNLKPICDHIRVWSGMWRCTRRRMSLRNDDHRSRAPFRWWSSTVFLAGAFRIISCLRILSSLLSSNWTPLLLVFCF